MRSHIDWLTYTVTMHYMGEGADAYASALLHGIVDMHGDLLATRIFGGTWEKKERSRAPYTDAWTLVDQGISIYASPNLTHACIEISGQGCERLIKLEFMDKLLQKISERCTRIDVACDIETDVTPEQFVAETTHQRMRASGYQKSESGETAYVGSQKSDRYARVYRYFSPHPRAKLLRVEHVFRKDYAKTVCNAILEVGADATAKSAGVAFGWAHSVWNPNESEGADLSIVHAERKMGKTVYWLIKACAPAFKRLVADGTITDAEGFLQSYFMPHD